MSEENVEIVRAFAEAFARGDYEASMAGLDQDIEFISPPDVTGGGGVWRGREEARRGFISFLGTWTDYRYEVRDVIDCGDEVFVEGWQRGRGKGSGAEVSESIYTNWTVRGGSVIRLRMFRDRADALEAAGVPE
jgi:ketosteroid isomerase-like protein